MHEDFYLSILGTVEISFMANSWVMRMILE